MSTQEILLALPHLSDEERERIASALRDLSASQITSQVLLPTRARTPGLHPGAWEVAPDFDEPLPEGFWLGNDA